MPADEMYEVVPLTRSTNLINTQESAASSLLSDAYEWGKNHKFEIGAAVLTIGLAAAAAGKMISNSRQAMAELYGPGTKGATIPALRFVAHDSAELGGRIGVVPAPNFRGSLGPSDQALNAPLHEIPTFSNFFDTASKGVDPKRIPHLESAVGALTRGVLK